MTGETFAAIAVDYRVAWTTVRAICRRGAWGHVLSLPTIRRAASSLVAAGILLATMVVAPAGAETTSSISTAAPAAPTPTPSLAERIKQLETARADLAARCQTGIAQHDGAIAVLKQLQGEP